MKKIRKGVKKRCEIAKRGVKSLFNSKPMQVIYIIVAPN